jgi:F0F1-type ATP synthase assembly protein I
MSKNNNKEIVQAFSMVLQFGLNMMIPIVLCMALGIWLGDKYDIDWIVIPLFFVGALAGYNSIFRMVKGMLKDSDTKSKRDTTKENDVKKD